MRQRGRERERQREGESPAGGSLHAVRRASKYRSYRKMALSTGHVHTPLAAVFLDLCARAHVSLLLLSPWAPALRGQRRLSLSRFTFASPPPSYTEPHPRRLVFILVRASPFSLSPAFAAIGSSLRAFAAAVAQHRARAGPYNSYVEPRAYALYARSSRVLPVETGLDERASRPFTLFSPFVRVSRYCQIIREGGFVYRFSIGI